jgi:hypothetical protein
MPFLKTLQTMKRSAVIPNGTVAANGETDPFRYGCSYRFFRGFDKSVDFVNKNNHRIILSSIVVAQLYAGVKGDAHQGAAG